MGKKVTLSCILICAALSPLFPADETLRFVLPSFEPFTFKKKGKIQGIGVQKVKRILKASGAKFSLRLVPNYGRAVQEVRIARADGFFLATRNTERDTFAVFSERVLFNRWSWFVLKNSKLLPGQPGFKGNARIGTNLNTNTHKWLLKNGFKVSHSPNQVRLLPLLLMKKRVDSIFLAELVFTHNARVAGISPRQYKQVVQRSRPFGIYISKLYLSKNPGFMRRLNRAIRKHR